MKNKGFAELTTPENTITYHNALCLSPQILHKHCFQFLLGPFELPRETEDNAYTKFWSDKRRVLWYVMVFLEWSIWGGIMGNVEVAYEYGF